MRVCLSPLQEDLLREQLSWESVRRWGGGSTSAGSFPLTHPAHCMGLRSTASCAAVGAASDLPLALEDDGSSLWQDGCSLRSAFQKLFRVNSADPKAADQRLKVIQTEGVVVLNVIFFLFVYRSTDHRSNNDLQFCKHCSYPDNQLEKVPETCKNAPCTVTNRSCMNGVDSNVETAGSNYLTVLLHQRKKKVLPIVL